jgi:hypothetical protein
VRQIILSLLISTLFLVSPFAHCGSGPEVNSLAPIQVTYTGKLFGYYRIEPGEHREHYLSPVQAFLNTVAPTGGDNLLLGMGDNFGPEFGASMQLTDRGPDTNECQVKFPPLRRHQAKYELPKDLYKADDRIAPFARCDNVVHFLQEAGYRAIVPGREDFMYSTTWLNQIARLMRDETKLNILAANLRLQYKYKAPNEAGNSHPPNEEKERAQNFCPLALSKNLMPYVGKDKVSTLPAGQTAPCAKADAPDFLEHFGQYLEDGLADEKDSEASDWRKKEGREKMLAAIRDEQKDVGYTVANLEGRKVLLIGVVGQETIKAVSPLILTMCLPHPLTISGSDVKPVSCDDEEGVKPLKESLKGNVKALDPVRTVAAILLATAQCDCAYRILMAQMPHTEAEELAAHLRALARMRTELPQLDLVISEAQQDHATRNVSVTEDHRSIGENWTTTPVVTPTPAFNVEEEGLDRPDWTAMLNRPVILKPGSVRRSITNFQSSERVPWLLPREGQKETTAHLLIEAVKSANPSVHFIKMPKPSPPQDFDASQCSPKGPSYTENKEGCNVAVMEFLLSRMQLDSHADVTMLERRDMYLGPLPKGYTDYEPWCNPLHKFPEPDYAGDACKLRVALDRVLWKGDGSERVMVSGKDLKDIMTKAEGLSNEEQSLEAQDISQQWLVTFGIMAEGAKTSNRSKPKPTDGKQLALNTKKFFVIPNQDCVPIQDDGSNKTYCVNGRPIDPDHAYSVSTSDHLAEDSAVYSVLSKFPKDYHEESKYFLTQKIAATIVTMNSPKVSSVVEGESEFSTQSELSHQKRGLFQLDIAKMVFGYNVRKPEGGTGPQGGDQYVAQTFQGATDSRASSVYTSELDAESKIRGLWNTKWVGVGTQSDVAFDRSVQGNLLGNPANATYALNNMTTGGFLQIKIPPLSPRTPSNRRFWMDALETTIHARKSVVLAPYQYQRQINGSYLFIPFFPTTMKGQITQSIPLITGFANKGGYRWEASEATRKWYLWDPGSYVEFGIQLTLQHNVLSSLTLDTPGNEAYTCDANGAETIANCFKAKGYPVNKDTTVIVGTKTLHSSGFYWDMHIQKNIFLLADHSPGASLVIETQGDSFFRRGAAKALSTQTLYDVPLSVALAFPIFRNLSLAPTYSTFFYGNQVAAQHLWVNGFTINARWYVDRDSAVRGFEQLLFKGPASADQTKSAKMK